MSGRGRRQLPGSIVLEGYTDGPRAEHLDLSVASGEMAVVCAGPGGGKTNLAIALAGLSGRSRGTVRISGAVPGSPDARASGLVLLDPPSFDPSREVLHQLSLRLWARGGCSLNKAFARAAGWCSDSGLSEASRRRAGTLPPGILKALNVGLVDLSSFDALVLDDPLTSLSDTMIPPVLDSIRRARQHAAVLVLCSDPVRFLEEATRVIRLPRTEAARSSAGEV
jgi:ABC-type multidrug transport system ATPase subunit